MCSTFSWRRKRCVHWAVEALERWWERLSVVFFALCEQFVGHLIGLEGEVSPMKGEITDADTAVEIAKDYADEECVGELGEVLDASRENNNWSVEFRTPTFSDTYKHHVQLSPIGNVFSHDRTP